MAIVKVKPFTKFLISFSEFVLEHVQPENAFARQEPDQKFAQVRKIKNILWEDDLSDKSLSLENKEWKFANFLSLDKISMALIKSGHINCAFQIFTLKLAVTLFNLQFYFFKWSKAILNECIQCLLGPTRYWLLLSTSNFD